MFCWHFELLYLFLFNLYRTCFCGVERLSMQKYLFNTDVWLVIISLFQVMLNTERLLKHAVQERLAVTICINKVQTDFCWWILKASELLFDCTWNKINGKRVNCLKQCMYIWAWVVVTDRITEPSFFCPSFSDWSTDVGVKASPYRCLLQIKTYSGWSEWTTQVWMSEFMCCATVCREAMKIILIVNLSKTKESSTLSEVLLQICLIIFMFHWLPCN